MTHIREARADEADTLVALDRASMRTLRAAGIELADDDGQLTGDLVLVADSDDSPVGFAVVTRHGRWWHLDQISVHPDHGRHGIGSALVAEVVDRARGAGAQGVTLTTFRDVAFNGRWYARLGFVEVDEATHPWLQEARAEERARGIDVAPRCAMALALG